MTVGLEGRVYVRPWSEIDFGGSLEGIARLFVYCVEKMVSNISMSTDVFVRSDEVFDLLDWSAFLSVRTRLITYRRTARCPWRLPNQERHGTATCPSVSKIAEVWNDTKR